MTIDGESHGRSRHFNELLAYLPEEQSRFLPSIYMTIRLHSAAPSPAQAKFLNVYEMHPIVSNFAILTFAFAYGSPESDSKPTDLDHAGSVNSTSPDVVANWSFTAYSDGSCNNQINQNGGNTPSGCVPLPETANSFKFRSSIDPEAGVGFSVALYADLDCGRQIGQNAGKSDDCKTLTFESYEVYATM